MFHRFARDAEQREWCRRDRRQRELRRGLSLHVFRGVRWFLLLRFHSNHRLSAAVGVEQL